MTGARPRILVVGCGSIGGRHAANAGRLAEVAVYDPDTGAARSVGTETGARVFGDLASAYTWKPDGVVVATPHATHVDVALQALQQGAHVLIEKPLTNRVEQVSPLREALARAPGGAWVVSNMRYHPGVSTIRKHLGRVGRPIFTRAVYGNHLPSMRPGADYRRLYCASRAAGGGVILDAIHELDYLSWMFGPIEDAVGTAATLGELEIDVEDYASLTCTHRGGVRSHVHLDYLRQWKRRGCEVVGDAGTLVWESEGKNPERCTVRLYERGAEREECLLDLPEVDANQPYVVQIEKFIAAIRGGTADELHRVDEAADLVQMAIRAREQAEGGSGRQTTGKVT